MHFIGAAPAQKEPFALFCVVVLLGCVVAVSFMSVRQDRKRQVEEQQRQRRAEWEGQQEQEEFQRSMRRRLDQDCAEILRSAEAAVEAILASTARAQGLLDPPVDEKLLREHVQAISVAGGRVTELRAKQRSIETMISAKSVKARPVREGFSGVRRVEATNAVEAIPMTAAVLKPQQQALARVLEAAKSRLLNLEHYASSVKAVDAAYWDFIGSQQAERLNEQVRDLLANTVRDELAVEELKRLTEKASVAEQAFYEKLYKANLAAETLALPDDENS